MNRLASEKSPYLLQHAENPVDWYPWGEEAFEKARTEDKPIFLSIGYSTCHWCHVMERESFEDERTAGLLNESFVPIKVDREERPDVDRVYMTTVQALTGSGGWPLSVWLTPDLKPFYGGTYYPPEGRYGRPGFPEVLTQLARTWREEREKVLRSSQEIFQSLERHLTSDSKREGFAFGQNREELERSLRTGYSQLYSAYDTRLGGFGSAPKFPRPSAFQFLLRYWARSGEKSALDMSLETLHHMWAGGMYDHLGGGFHRYSVDAYWRVPHFEKMLYDQAQLVWSYLEAFQVTADPFFAGVAREILEYVLRDMTAPEGGFYSAEDADSAPDPARPDEKEEGAFYLWTREEVVALLGEEEARIFNDAFGVSETGNTISDPMGEFGHRNVLHAAASPEELARRLGRSAEEIRAVLDRARSRLFRSRCERPRPHLDDKILTSWNGLMISAFARASQVLEEPRYLEAARRAATFVRDRLYDESHGTLQRRYRDGEAGYPAQLDDYAFYIQALLDLYEAGFEIEWLDLALTLTGTQIDRFVDPEGGGFFDSSSEDPSIILRTKELYDGAEPAGNSIAVSNLQRLAHMLDRSDLRELAEGSVAHALPRLRSDPHALPQMLASIDRALDPPRQIVVAGQPGAEDTRTLLRAIHRRFLPNKLLVLADGGPAQKRLARSVGFYGSVERVDEKATAYVCESFTCRLPTNEVEELERLLDDA